LSYSRDSFGFFCCTGDVAHALFSRSFRLMKMPRVITSRWPAPPRRHVKKTGDVSCSVDVILDKCGVGPDRLQRARHNPVRLIPPRRREVVLLRDPPRTVFVPITHCLVHAATVYTARQAAHLLYKVTNERRAWPKFQMVDVAIQGLLHCKDDCKDEFRHATKSLFQIFQNSLSRRSAEAIRTLRSACRFVSITNDERSSFGQ